ncbi:MAG: DNA repair protein RadA [Chloroflexi bacterium]|nr:DNA repair protein RadA [Chloroflexota bacterium]
MSPKPRVEYVCQNCGRRSPKPLGRCPSCGAWGSFVEEIIAPVPARRSGPSVTQQPRPIADIPAQDEARWPLPMAEMARVLGGGIVPGSIVLLGGDPGIGKSTLLLQTALEMARSFTVLYVSGEESEAQIKMRAQRLWRTPQGRPRPFPKNLYLVTETNLDAILAFVDQLKPHILIIDSIQTVSLPELQSSAGSVSQVRESAARLQALAKQRNIAVFLIGHVTKEGILAGPKVLEHIVDTVLYLEGDRFHAYRLLRSVKNRFGATDEVGVFEMHDRGLVEVPNPSEVFLAGRLVNAAGSAIAVTMEGTRPLLVEVQGLTSPTAFGHPRRAAIGVDYNRLLLVLAVLQRRLGLRLADQDVFVSVVGGLQVREPAADLAIAAAVASSRLDRPLRADVVLIGEVGLAGELRAVGQLAARLREAAQLGFRHAVVPRRLARSPHETWPDGITVHEATTLRQALDLAWQATSTEPSHGE